MKTEMNASTPSEPGLKRQEAEKGLSWRFHLGALGVLAFISVLLRVETRASTSVLSN
jgi:hypothetical protein